MLDVLELEKCNSNYILFTKLPWPGDGEGTFQSSIQAAPCLPYTVKASHCPFLLLNAKQESYECQFLMARHVVIVNCIIDQMTSN